MPETISYSLQNLSDTAQARYHVHKQNALTFHFDPPLPHNQTELQAYLKAERRRKKLLDHYYETEDSYSQACLRENEKHRYNMIRLRTVLDTVGDDNDAFEELFIQHYAAQTVELLYNSIARGLNAKTDDLKFRLPEVRPELAPLASSLKKWTVHFKALADYIGNRPGITAVTPLFDVHHNLQLVSPPAYQSFHQIAHDCMLHDFREGDVDLNQISTLLTATLVK